MSRTDLTTQPQTAMSTCNAAVTHSPHTHALRPSSLMMTATRADQPQARVMTRALLSRVKMAELARIRVIRTLAHVYLDMTEMTVVSKGIFSVSLLYLSVTY